jgi:hypothetical protein
MDKLKSKFDLQNMLDKRNIRDKTYDEALRPKIPKHRIPDRETIDAHLTKDAQKWQHQKEHEYIIHQHKIPKNQSDKTLKRLS